MINIFEITIIENDYMSLRNIAILYKWSRDTTRSKVVIRVNYFQTELMVEIHSKSLARAIGKVLCMTFS